MNPLRVSRSAYLTTVTVLATSAIGLGAGIRAAGLYLQKLPIYPASPARFKQ